MEQEEYVKEEIDWSYIEFVDNQDVLDLIEKVQFFLLNYALGVQRCHSQRMLLLSPHLKTYRKYFSSLT